VTLLIVTPLTEELDFLTAALTQLGNEATTSSAGPIQTTSFRAIDAIVAHGGHGKTQMAVHTRYLLDSVQGIEAVICAGAAGALSDGLAVGDIVIATQTIEHDYQLKFATRPLPAFPGDAGLLEKIRSRIDPAGFAVHFDVVTSGDEDVIDVSRGRDLARLTGAIAVAWEGVGTARACNLTNVPHIEIRGITDTANHTAPADFETNLEVAMTNIATLVNQVTPCG
jgi:adenosylhomocysteine nucleosidase